MTESIKIKYHADIEPIEKITVGDWIDLRAAEDVKIGKGAFKLISLGVSMKLPDGYEAHIVPRSSTFKNWGIIQTNGMGIIDNSYSGTNDVWKFPAYCLAPTGCEWDKDNYLLGMPGDYLVISADDLHNVYIEPGCDFSEHFERKM